MGSRTLVTGFGIGALAAYLLDPERGARRRGVIRDKLVSAGSAADDAVDATGRDVANRARGVVADMRAWLRANDTADDTVIAERVRAKLGGLVSHPGAIDVSVSSGRLTLRGHLFTHEAPRLVRRVASVRGVRAVDDRLERRDAAGGERMEFMQTHWSPAARLLGGTVGAGLALYGRTRAGMLGTVIGGAGAALLTRALFNVEL